MQSNEATSRVLSAVVFRALWDRHVAATAPAHDDPQQSTAAAAAVVDGAVGAADKVEDVAAVLERVRAVEDHYFVLHTGPSQHAA